MDKGITGKVEDQFNKVDFEDTKVFRQFLVGSIDKIVNKVQELEDKFEKSFLNSKQLQIFMKYLYDRKGIVSSLFDMLSIEKEGKYGQKVIDDLRDILLNEEEKRKMNIKRRGWILESVWKVFSRSIIVIMVLFMIFCFIFFKTIWENFKNGNIKIIP